MMTAATAFRTFFISGVGNREPLLPESREPWYAKGKRLLRYTFTPRSWRSKSSTRETRNEDNWDRRFDLPLQAPRATMTGIRTFIHGQGKTKTGDSHIMHSMVEEGYEDSARGRSEPSIMVQRDIAVRSEHV